MPALANTFLFIEPMQHNLDYGSVVLHQIVQASRQAGQTIVELIGNDATPENTLDKLRTMQPMVFSMTGHGNVDVTSVECTAVLVRTGSAELDVFKDKVVDMVSCLTAQELGPAIIDAGAVAYLGYKEEFWFFVGDAPGATRAVQSPFLAAFQFTMSLLQGKSTGDARKNQTGKYDEEIAYWTTGAGKDDMNSMELARILEMNKSNSVFLGQGTVTPSPAGALAGATLPAPLVFGLASIVLGYAIYKELVLS